MKYLRAVVVGWVIAMSVLFVVGVSNSSDECEDLREEYDTLRSGYTELQQEHSKALERIEYLEYRIMSGDSISEELKQEIKENVLEEDK